MPKCSGFDGRDPLKDQRLIINKNEYEEDDCFEDKDDSSNRDVSEDKLNYVQDKLLCLKNFFRLIAPEPHILKEDVTITANYNEIDAIVEDVLEHDSLNCELTLNSPDYRILIQSESFAKLFEKFILRDNSTYKKSMKSLKDRWALKNLQFPSAWGVAIIGVIEMLRVFDPKNKDNEEYIVENGIENYDAASMFDKEWGIHIEEHREKLYQEKLRYLLIEEWNKDCVQNAQIKYEDDSNLDKIYDKLSEDKIYELSNQIDIQDAIPLEPVITKLKNSLPPNIHK